MDGVAQGDYRMLGRYIPRTILRKQRGERALRRRFLDQFGYHLPANPKTFSEKLFARMIEMNNGDPKTETALTDKLAVRHFVSQRIGAAYLTPILWVGNRPEDIPFENLPTRYVVKTNHGSGSVSLVNRDPDKTKIVRDFRRWLETNYYWGLREAQYYKIPPRVYVEEFVGAGNDEAPLDYRFFCFHGKPTVIQIDNHGHNINSFYDCDWNKLDLYYREDADRPDIERPENLAELLDLASRLAAGFPFVRVDLYSDGANARFGEMTFTPTAGNMKLQPEIWDERLGALI